MKLVESRIEGERPLAVVDMDDWFSVEGGLICTEGASPCTVVVVHDAETKRAYLGHFSQLALVRGDGQRKFIEMVEAIKTREEVSRLAVWLGGANYKIGTVEDWSEDILTDRQFAIDSLEQAGLNPHLVRLEWNEAARTDSNVYFDAESGTLKVETKPW